jgi:hypothetical protein
VAGSRRYPHSRASSRKSISLSSLGNSATTKLRAEVKALDGKGNPPNRRKFCGSAPIIVTTNHHSQCDLKFVDVTLARRMQPFGNNVGVDCYPGLSWKNSLANNGGQMENFLAQIAISVNLELRTSRTTIDTFGEEPCRLFKRLRIYSPNARRSNAIACGPSTGRLAFETSRLISRS